MNRNISTLIAATVAALATGSAMAADDLYYGILTSPITASASSARVPDATRERVKAELAEARRTGSLPGNEYYAPLNELYPQQYPPVAHAAGKTREQVKAELAEARANGALDHDLYYASVPAPRSRFVAKPDGSRVRAATKSETRAAVDPRGEAPIVN